jgi:hypothetical protein
MILMNVVLILVLLYLFVLLVAFVPAANAGLGFGVCYVDVDGLIVDVDNQGSLLSDVPDLRGNPRVEN